jgi:AbiV family abortive infection protein
MDLRTVKSVPGDGLAACASAAARNAQRLLIDAQILASAGAVASAYSLAALAVEECGKAVGLAALAMLPRTARTRAAAGKVLVWHQLKLVGGLLIAAVTTEEPGVATKLAAMSAAQAAHVVNILAVPADEADRLRQRGLYVDMDRNGRIHEPSEVTRADVAAQLARAQQAVSSASILLTPEGQDRIAHPPVQETELARALVDALAQAPDGRTPEDAAEVVLEAVDKLHISGSRSPRTGSRSGRAGRPGAIQPPRRGARSCRSRPGAESASSAES